MTPDLAALIERLEKASGPSRILDAQIEVEHRKLHALAIGLTEEVRAKWYVVGTKGEVEDDPRCRYHAPEYTGSFDAVLTLLPEGAEYEISTIHRVAYVRAPLNSEDCMDVTRKDGNVILAMAECFLRARAAITKGG